MCASIKRPKEVAVTSVMDIKNAYLSEVPIEEKMSVHALATVIMNFIDDSIEGYEDTMHALQFMGTRPFVPKNLDLDL